MARRVLVVDDHEPSLTLFQAQLETAGYHVTGKSSGEDALRLLDDFRFDLLVLDIMMPDLDGIEVCRKIRERGIGPEVPVLFLTAVTDHATRIRALLAGGDDLLSKPVDRNQLLERVSTLVERAASRV